MFKYIGDLQKQLGLVAKITRGIPQKTQRLTFLGETQC